MKKINYFLLFLIFFSQIFIFSKDQTDDNLKLDDNLKFNGDKLIIDIKTAINLAQANNLGLKSEKLKYDNSKWKMYTSWNVFLPSVTMSATMAKSNLNENERAAGQVYPIDEVAPGTGVYDRVMLINGTVPEWSLMANFNLSLSLNAAMGFSVYQTVLDWQSGKINLDIAKKKLIRDVQKNLYNLILLEKKIEIMQDSIKIAEKRYTQAIINYRNGLISEYDMLSAQVSFMNLKPVLVELKNGYDNALLAFKQMIGIKKDVLIQLDASIENSDIKKFNSNDLIKNYLNKNLDIISLNNNIKMLANARNIAISMITPSFNLMYTMDPTFQDDPLTNQWFGDGNYMEDYWKQRSGMLSITISLPVESWFPFSKEQMNIVNSAYTLQQTKISFENLKQGVELQIESSVMKLEKSNNSLESLNLSKMLAKKAWDKAEEAWRQGTMDQLEVQNAENGYRQAEYNLLSEQYNYVTGLLDLEYLVNSKLD